MIEGPQVQLARKVIKEKKETVVCKENKGLRENRGCRA